MSKLDECTSLKTILHTCIILFLFFYKVWVIFDACLYQKRILI